MAQNLSTEMKPGAVSVAAQQGLYFSQSPLPPTQTVAGESYCTVSQSQTINFTQQTLRQRTPTRPADKMMHPQMIRAQQVNFMLVWKLFITIEMLIVLFFVSL